MTIYKQLLIRWMIIYGADGKMKGWRMKKEYLQKILH